MEKKKRIINKIGNVYGIPLGDGKKCYMQYIAKDSKVWNSDIVRVFSKKYTLNESPTIDEILSDDILFYSHIVLRIAVHQADIWKEGASNELGLEGLNKIIFYDIGYIIGGSSKISRAISRFEGSIEYTHEEIPETSEYESGMVWSIDAIITKINTGNWPFDPRKKVEDISFLPKHTLIGE